jgi:hypothetical protein
MRSRLFFGVCAALMAVSRLAVAQSDRLAAGLVPGDYVRASAGVAVPINPQGSLRDWSRGTTANLAWENWQTGGSSGVGRLGVAINVSYSLLPLDEANFVSDFIPIQGGKATSASASRAGIFELATNFRFRIPAPLLMPTINLGIGFLNWRPSTIDYSGPTGSGTAKQRSRNGGELSIGGGLERHIVDRYGLFAEAMYSYGFTSLGQGSVTPGGVCSATSCDALKNTSVAVIRGGLSVRIRD